MFPPLSGCGIKVCGVTTAEQLAAVAACGVDAIGLNFWPKSKRYISPHVVQSWQLSQLQATLVAVTVNATLDELRAIRELTPVQMLQLHGDESPAQVEAAMGLGLPVIKALQVRDAASLAQIADHPCDTLLLDSYNPGLYGGEGKTFPWALMNEAKLRYPQKRFILAGGLTVANVAEAVQGVRPAAVDVASGVESAPGVKDMELVRSFVRAVRNGSAGVPPVQETVNFRQDAGAPIHKNYRQDAGAPIP